MLTFISHEKETQEETTLQKISVTPPSYYENSDSMPVPALTAKELLEMEIGRAIVDFSLATNQNIHEVLIDSMRAVIEHKEPFKIYGIDLTGIKGREARKNELIKQMQKFTTNNK